MNKSIFMGHLVRDPEIRYTDTEKGELMIANFRIGVKRKFVRKDGVDSDFFSVTAFGRLAEFVEKYFLQGSKVIVTGRMENDNYENTHGEKVYGMRLIAEDIDFAESKKAMEARMKADEDDRREQSSGRNPERSSSGRTGSSSRERDTAKGRNSGSSRRPAREEDYEDEREEDRNSGRRGSGRSSGSRSTGGRSSGSRSSGSSRSAGRSRSVDDEYLDASDEDLDFD